MMDKPIVLSLKNLTKQYPGVLALDQVSLDFVAGEVHALLGENGAGKSTLIKAIAGAIEPDDGVIRLDGQEYAKMTPHLARSLGDRGHLPGVQPGAVAVGRRKHLSGRQNRAAGLLVDTKVMVKRASAYSGSSTSTSTPTPWCATCRSAQQQIVEIAKAVSKNVKLLIMDEPTAPLTVTEVESMFEIVRQLKAQGVTMIYISHRLEEIFRICGPGQRPARWPLHRHTPDGGDKPQGTHQPDGRARAEGKLPGAPGCAGRGGAGGQASVRQWR